ncbi:hypothetical protein HYPDE_38218 [Hyphomicrobium denitrificans 1NES1]|uniref:Uncharacterized protein n=1 Tax=Hyphomicrobium denitrificans 1NES1 TaxID=670307 RepID=N0BGP0_9HYPH|nr:hypothetical protein HYPDE_38218 [Hyphomicrobium denitrificans 1NES1]
MKRTKKAAAVEREIRLAPETFGALRSEGNRRPPKPRKIDLAEGAMSRQWISAASKKRRSSRLAEEIAKLAIAP